MFRFAYVVAAFKLAVLISLGLYIWSECNAPGYVKYKLVSSGQIVRVFYYRGDNQFDKPLGDTQFLDIGTDFSNHYSDSEVYYVALSKQYYKHNHCEFSVTHAVLVWKPKGWYWPWEKI